MKPSATSATKTAKPSAPALPKAPAKNAPAEETLEKLRENYPDAYCELNHETPFQLLAATILSAQCTDVRVNMVTPLLFKYFPTPQDMADAPIEKIEDLIRSTGFYKNKAKSLKGMAQALVERHGGEVPPRLEDLVVLPGVGRKTANVVLGNAFGITAGIVVDTHVARLSFRFGWTKSENPVQIEKDLQAFVPEDRWVQLSHELIFHGRRVCFARKPQCETCFLLKTCPRIGVQ